ncbi:MAG: hypothetical protein ACE5E5_01030 [Phycisphaerae bacterium]
MTTIHRPIRPYAGSVLALSLAAGAVMAWAQEQVDAPKDLTMVIDQGFAELIGRYDWQSDAANVKHAMVNLFEQNGWDTEADRFASQLAGEIAEIPPWDPIQRIDRVSSRLADRYGIPQAGEFRIKTRMMLEVSEFFGRHADVIFEQTRRFVSKRMAGQPYTAEDVAEWSKATAGMNVELREWGERMYREIATMVDPVGLKRLNHDLASFDKRMTYLEKMDKVWRAGGWEPSHWGMQDDPVQNGTHPGMRVGRGAPQATSEPQRALDNKPPRRWYAHAPRTWIAYVFEFQRRYGFDPAQLTAINSIHRELLDRADAYAESRAEELGRVAVRDRPTHPLYQPICALFAELRERLDAVPTTGQKEAPVRKERTTDKEPAEQK